MFYPCDLGAVLRCKPEARGKCEKKRDTGRLWRVVSNEAPEPMSYAVRQGKVGVIQSKMPPAGSGYPKGGHRSGAGQAPRCDAGQ